MRSLRRFAIQQDGTSSAEYAVILAVVGAAIAIAAINLGSAVGNSINVSADCVSDSSDCSG